MGVKHYEQLQQCPKHTFSTTGYVPYMCEHTAFLLVEKVHSIKLADTLGCI